MYKVTHWKGSEMTGGPTYTPIEPGPRTVKITRAEYVEEEGKEPYYSLYLKEVNADGTMPQRYWFEGDSGSAAAQRSSLIMLNKAIFGPNAAGVPFPDDIVGAVVSADVETNNKGFPRVYKWYPASEEDVLNNTDLDAQYYRGCTDEEIEELR